MYNLMEHPNDNAHLLNFFFKEGLVIFGVFLSLKTNLDKALLFSFLLRDKNC